MGMTQKGTPLRVAGGLLNFDKDGKAADEAIHKTRFPCHEPGKAHDYLFTYYAP